MTRDTRGRPREPRGTEGNNEPRAIYLRGDCRTVSENRFFLFGFLVFVRVVRATCVARRDARLTVYGARWPPADTERCSHRRRRRRCRAKRVPTASPPAFVRFRKVDAPKTVTSSDSSDGTTDGRNVAAKIGTWCSPRRAVLRGVGPVG